MASTIKSVSFVELRTNMTGRGCNVLIACRANTTRSFGGEMSDVCEFRNIDEANEILGLMMRHWNTIAATLHKGEVHVPLLLEDENGMAHGNDWAHGFMRGMGMEARRLA
jgi:hypothetical protein